MHGKACFLVALQQTKSREGMNQKNVTSHAEDIINVSMCPIARARRPTLSEPMQSEGPEP